MLLLLNSTSYYEAWFSIGFRESSLDHGVESFMKEQFADVRRQGEGGWPDGLDFDKSLD